MVDAWMVTGQDVPDLPLWRQARRADPVTSKIAARMAGGLRTDHQQRILNSLGQGPALTAHQVNKRLTELGRHGLIVTTGRTVRSAAGRPEREWRVA